MKNQVNKLTKGFTIIEVMIVLAIAGLIMAIIFLAVPALQRNSHNNSRRSDAAHLAGIVNEYTANHAGVLPTGAQLVTATSGENWAIMSAPTAASVVAGTGTLGTLTTTVVNTGTTCNATTGAITTTGASARSFSITYSVETSGGGSSPVCLQG